MDGFNPRVALRMPSPRVDGLITKSLEGQASSKDTFRAPSPKWTSTPKYPKNLIDPQGDECIVT